jgi:hypothetical protein
VRLRAAALLACGVWALLGGCATPRPVKAPPRAAAEVRAQLEQLLPATLADRRGWAVDIQAAFQGIDVPASTENLCAALAVTEQESGFDADPAVTGLGRIARREIEQRAARLKIPSLVVATALKLGSPDGRSYATRIAAVRTEKELSAVYEDLIDEVPLGRRLFSASNPVRTGGPMQVSIQFAEDYAAQHRTPYARRDSIRHAVFTRAGGMYFGIAHLLDYPNSYERHIHRFADFNAGWYASRNAAFQAAVTVASGVPLALDGDLILHGTRRGDAQVGATETAVRSIGAQLDLDDVDIRQALELGDRLEFEHTDLYARVFGLAEQIGDRALPRAVIPRITLQSPKITRKLTTEWFATRVQQRYQRCVNRAFALEN